MDPGMAVNILNCFQQAELIHNDDSRFNEVIPVNPPFRDLLPA